MTQEQRIIRRYKRRAKAFVARQYSERAPKGVTFHEMPDGVFAGIPLGVLYRNGMFKIDGVTYDLNTYKNGEPVIKFLSRKWDY